MSLLEDIFLQDEANEAQELERVIEGGDYEERLASNIDGDSGKEDEAGTRKIFKYLTTDNYFFNQIST